MDSTLSHLAASRAAVSKTRQNFRLESDPKVQAAAGGNMRPIAPPTIPANKPGAAQKTVQDDIDYDNFQLKPEKEMAMLSRIQQFIDRNGNGIDDRQEGSAPQPAAAPAQPVNTPPAPVAPPTAAAPQDPRVAAALTPVREFFTANGRLPTPEELSLVAATRQLKAQLGRDPTESEIMLYRTAPPRGLGADGK